MAPTSLLRPFRNNSTGEHLIVTNHLARILQILQRKQKSNPILLHDDPLICHEYIHAFTTSNFVTGEGTTQFFEFMYSEFVSNATDYSSAREIFKFALSEIKNTPGAILIVEDFHKIMGSPESVFDMRVELVPPLARSEIRMIATSNRSAYRTCIESDGAIERRFQLLELDSAGANVSS